MASGELRGSRVRVGDEKEAATLYNKGAYGVPQSGGALELDLLEAAYLVEQNRLDVAGAAFSDLVASGTRAEPDFLVRFGVYRDLRQRTFVVRASGEADFNVFSPGSIPGKVAAKALVRAVSERGAFEPAAILALARSSDASRRRLLAAVLDEEGDVTYYEMTLRDVRGRRAADLAGVKATGVLVADRVLVYGKEDADALAEAGSFGHRVGEALHLSFAEARFLAEAGALAIEDGADLARRAEALHPDFARRFATYRDLRERGLVVKTGLKFGTHFRVYERDAEEEHAPWLVHALDPDSALPWPELAGFVRLTHGVRKRMLFAIGSDYLEVKWTKP